MPSTSRFNFCIQCRQYACVNCWNEPAGRCRTCVPIPGTDDLIDRFEATFHAHHPAGPPDALSELDAADLNRRLGVEAWPTEDLSTAAATNGHAAVEVPAEAFTDQALTVAPEAPPVADEAAAEPAATEQTALEELVSESDLWAGADQAASQELTVFEPASPMLPALEGAGAGPGWEDDVVFELEPEPEPVAAIEPEPEPFAAFESEPEPEQDFHFSTMNGKSISRHVMRTNIVAKVLVQQLHGLLMIDALQHHRHQCGMRTMQFHVIWH